MKTKLAAVMVLVCASVIAARADTVSTIPLSFIAFRVNDFIKFNADITTLTGHTIFLSQFSGGFVCPYFEGDWPGALTCNASGKLPLLPGASAFFHERTFRERNRFITETKSELCWYERCPRLQ